MATPQVMMVGGFTEIFQKARDSGLELTVAQQADELAPQDLQLVARLITLPMDDPVLVEVAEVLHRASPFDSVLSFQEFGLENAALIRERLGLFGNPIEPVMLTRDKARMRQHLCHAGIPTTPHLVSNSVRELREFGDAVGWPIILKPRRGSGSRQIHCVPTAAEVAPALARMYAVDPHTRVLAEKYVYGAEVSVEAITWDGRHEVLAVTDKLTTGAPHYVEMGHTMPSCLPPPDLDAIRALTVAFLTSIGHRYGPSHTEIIRSGNGPVIVESHTRAGGDRIFEMVEIISKVDMLLATLQGFAGHFSRPSRLKMTGGVAIRYLDVGVGVVRRVEGVDRAAAMPGVVRVDSHMGTGTILPPIRMSRDRPGYVLASGASAAQATANAMAALDEIRVDLD